MVTHSIERFDQSSKLASLVREYLEQQSLILEYIKKAKQNLKLPYLMIFYITIPTLSTITCGLELIATMFENLIDIFCDIQSYLTQVE